MSLDTWDLSTEGKYLLDAALRLPQRDREILADRLHASVDVTETEVGWQQAWAEELDRRDAELDSGEVQPLTLDDIRRTMQEARHGKVEP